LQVGFDARTLRDPVVQRHEARVFPFKPPHGPRKSVTQAFDNLKHRKIRGREATADQKPGLVARQHGFKISQEFRRTIFQEILRAPL
jgi:hypothetical protein